MLPPPSIKLVVKPPWRSLKLIVAGVLPSLPISSGKSPQRMQLLTLGLLPKRLYIPPPSLAAVLPLNAQLLTVGLLP